MRGSQWKIDNGNNYSHVELHYAVTSNSMLFLTTFEEWFSSTHLLPFSPIRFLSSASLAKKIIDPAIVTAEKLVDYLKRHEEIEKKLGKNNLSAGKAGRLVFYTTDDAGKFKNFGQKFLGGEIKEVKKAVL